jgi:hypothetical protein
MSAYSSPKLLNGFRRISHWEERLVEFYYNRSNISPNLQETHIELYRFYQKRLLAQNICT